MFAKVRFFCAFSKKNVTLPRKKVIMVQLRSVGILLRRLFSCFVLCFATTFLMGQVPDGYYNSAVGKSGEELRSALYDIIKGHTSIDYSALWNSYRTTDVMPSGKVWDIYSDVPGGTAAYYYDFGINQCGTYSQEGMCYNREHTVPQSWFDEATPMKSDLFHLYPTDGWVNNKRGNLPYGEVNSPTWTSTNGSKLGPCSYPGCTGNAFEPIDSFKGDLARTYFYMSVRYMDKDLGQEPESVFSGSNLVGWAKNMFLEWNNMDPVSQKEVNRNNVIYNTIQHNRNPFIDCPELVDYLFGSRYNEPWYPTCVAWDTTGLSEPSFRPHCRVYPNPAETECVVENDLAEITCVVVYNAVGQRLYTYDGIGDRRFVLITNNLSSGCYLLHVFTKEGREVMRLVVR